MVAHGVRKYVWLLNRVVAGVAFPLPGTISEQVRRQWLIIIIPVPVSRKHSLDLFVRPAVDVLLAILLVERKGFLVADDVRETISAIVGRSGVLEWWRRGFIFK
jgi:hypothetical protein